eukprot:3194004-Rhodomonas_salina.1
MLYIPPPLSGGRGGPPICPPPFLSWQHTVSQYRTSRSKRVGAMSLPDIAPTLSTGHRIARQRMPVPDIA